MSLAIGVVMDPIEAIHYKKDSTLAMLWAAQDRGWSLFYMEQRHLYARDGQSRASMAPLRVYRDAHHWFERGDYEDRALADLDIILMRKDPPFDAGFLYSTYLLEAAEAEGTLVVNRCQSLRDCNEKLFATQFPQCCPPLLVTADTERLKAFHREYRDVIFKPLDGMGGTSVFRVRQDDPNLGVILETLTERGDKLIMAQRYLPEIAQGDKRILVIDGEPLDFSLARIPAEGESRGNLAVGGRGEARPLSERDRWIVSQVAPRLRDKGLFFVGLDVIGDYLTEINVTSPTCIRELDDQQGLDVGAVLMERLAERVGKS